MVVNLKRKFVQLKNLLYPVHELIGLTDWWDRIEIICDKLIQSVEGNVDTSWWKQIFTFHQQHDLYIQNVWGNIFPNGQLLSSPGDVLRAL